MKRLFTADWHVGHHHILQYEKRPFKSAIHMIDQYIARANQMVKEDDIVYHVGDFACYGRERGEEGLRIKAKDILDQLNGTWIMIEGNHDSSNKVKAHADCLTTTIAKIPTVLSHFPSDIFYDKVAKHNCMIDKNNVELWICGHVHGKFKYFFDEKNNILNINVGMDVWNHCLVKETALIVYVQKLRQIIKEKMLIEKSGK